MLTEDFIRATTPLKADFAVAALIVTEDGRYLLQRRDDRPDIWYPGHWGLFGGAVEANETPRAALQRELREELELDVDPSAVELFSQFDFDLTALGQDKVCRTFFVVRVSASHLPVLVLHEGAAMALFAAKQCLCGQVMMAPYDSFALFLHYARARLQAADTLPSSAQMPNVARTGQPMDHN